MSMISERVKELRSFSEACKVMERHHIAKSLEEAADTIEALSAKLTAIIGSDKWMIDRRNTVNEILHKLGETSEAYEKVGFYEMSELMNQTLNAIASMTVEINEKDTERSAEDCGGGWIYCGDGENLPEIERDIILSTRSLDVYKGYRANTEGYFYAEGEGYILYENVLAWMPQPEPYHEP